jgi:hypothetical protein
VTSLNHSCTAIQALDVIHAVQQQWVRYLGDATKVDALLTNEIDLEHLAEAVCEATDLLQGVFENVLSADL